MRKFSVSLDSPTSCQCCGNALASEGFGISRGQFRLEFTEGADFALGEGIKVNFKDGKLHVALRHTRGMGARGRSWGLRKHYNTGAFARAKQDWVQDANPDFGWYQFSFELPEFKPTFSTWWAELVFVEIENGKKGFNGDVVESHNAATVRVKLETLA
jgi:hypothetical protein